MKYINKPKFILLTLSLTLLLTLSISYAKSVSNDISNSVFRLHIIANSDSVFDQELKLSVRDRILKDAGYLFENSTSAQDAAQIAKENLSSICEIALSEVEENGFDYKVTAKVDKFAFPTKTYQDISLPAGKYTALRIEIGEAKGKNWWCVMFPPLCLTDGVLALNEESKETLKNNLTTEEYNLVTKSPSGAVPVEVRFKIVEIFQKIF